MYCPNAFMMAPCSESRCELLLQLKDSIPRLSPTHPPPLSRSLHLPTHHILSIRDSLLGLMVLLLQLSGMCCSYICPRQAQLTSLLLSSRSTLCTHVFYLVKGGGNTLRLAVLLFFVDFFKYLRSSLMSPWRVVPYNQSLQMPLRPAQLQRVGGTITITRDCYLPG